MNFNYLMDQKRMRLLCKGIDKEACYWCPVGSLRATSGNNIAVSMYCKKCELREDIFLSQSEYKIQERILRNEVGDV